MNSAAFSPDEGGEWVVTAGRDRKAWLWRWRTGETVKLATHDDQVTDAAFSPDGKFGKLIVTASLDGTAMVWEVSTRKCLGTLKGHTAGLNSVAFSSDGKRIITTSNDNTARIWTLKTRETIVTFKLESTFKHESEMYKAAFSPDGKFIVTASADKTARIWDVRKPGKELKRFGHKGRVYSAAFSPDGKWVVTASDDWTVRIWDADTGQGVALPRRHPGPVNTAVFAPDGRSILTACNDHTARIFLPVYLASTDELKKLARQRVTRKLTPEEREVYLDTLPNR